MVDKTRTGQFVRKHFEAMVFTALVEELRTDVVACWTPVGSDWDPVANKSGPTRLGFVIWSH
ncbi:hypothetical protein ACIOHE_37140 [Streptomyces sp. NPDC087851]|uniref:hypothetical protein n=1 Tax=Streptomyces sp. NPDC087851 TaxID=3365810 RepID=UPI0037FC1638